MAKSRTVLGTSAEAGDAYTSWLVTFECWLNWLLFITAATEDVPKSSGYWAFGCWSGSEIWSNA